MKIVYLAQYFNTPSMIGATRHFEIARHLAAAGNEVHVVTTERETRKGFVRGWKHSVVNGIHIHRCPVPYSNAMSYFRRIISFIRYAWSSSLKATAIHPTIVFATSTPLTVAVPGILSSWKNKVPMVFEVRDLWPELPIAVGALKNPLLIRIARWLERQAYFHATRVIALSPDMRQGVIRTGYPEDKTSIIPNMASPDVFDVSTRDAAEFRDRYGIDRDAPVLLYAGTLGRINGVGYMARLAREAMKIDPGIVFLVLGDGKEEEEIRETAAREGVLGKNFFMYPRIPKEKVPVAFRAATMTASWFVDVREMWANSANKFFDSLAAGKPLVLNYGGWQKRLVEEHEAGIVVPPGDMEEAARKVASHITDRGWLDRASRAARSLAEKEFNREMLVGEAEGVLKDAEREGTLTRKLFV